MSTPSANTAMTIMVFVAYVVVMRPVLPPRVIPYVVAITDGGAREGGAVS